MKKIIALLLSILLLFTLSGCDQLTDFVPSNLEEHTSDLIADVIDDSCSSNDDVENEDSVIDASESYYDIENVILYIDTYGNLPSNYITKNQAKELGWDGGSVEAYGEGLAIGGDKFGNYEGLLPKADGRTYTECDIDTLGQNSRGAKRLCFSNDGLYFYTDDHYESFTEYYVENGKVKVK